MFTFLDSTGAGMGATGTWGTIIMIVIMFAVFYFFAIRPQKKQEKETQQMRDALSIGDEIVTIGGIVGTIVSIKDDRFVIETSADLVRVEFAKWALSSNESAVARAKEEMKKAEEARAKAKAEKKARKGK